MNKTRSNAVNHFDKTCGEHVVMSQVST